MIMSSSHRHRNDWWNVFVIGMVGGAGFQFGHMLFATMTTSSMVQRWFHRAISMVTACRLFVLKQPFGKGHKLVTSTDKVIDNNKDCDRGHDQERKNENDHDNDLNNENENNNDSTKRHRSESNASTATTSTSTSRYLEMLVHNVSHSDLVLSLITPQEGISTTNGISGDCKNRLELESLQDPNLFVHVHPHKKRSYDTRTSVDADLTLCRPRFSAFSMFCQRILENLSEAPILFFPIFDRSDETPRYSLVTPRPSRRQTSIPVGFRLGSAPEKKNNNGGSSSGNGVFVDSNEIPSLRFRGRDASKVPDLNEMMKAHRLSKDSDNFSSGKETPLSHQHTTSTPPSTQSDDDKCNANAPPSKPRYQLNAVFFPLLATLMSRWDDSIRTKYHSSAPKNIKKVVVLVSGVGTPRNWTHSILGNSTKECAELMKSFLERLYPDITVVLIHSCTNIFRYDQNILFAKRELEPVINSYRDAHARNLPYPDEMLLQTQTTPTDGSSSNSSVTTTTEEFDGPLCLPCSSSSSSEQTLPAMRTTSTQQQQQQQQRYPFSSEWKNTFHVTLSFADGSPCARLQSIQASLRPYKPTYFHVWQNKTFWHDTKISADDVEIHSFEDMETTPPIDISQASKPVQTVTDEMLRFRNEYIEKFMNGDHDIETFWLRKSKKPVLAVLLVAPDNILYRGTNMEVSMPTGSLCAERNVIGTALAQNPGLRREDLLMVAVLALPFEDLRHQRERQLMMEEAPPPTPPSACGPTPPIVPSVMKRSISFTSTSTIFYDYHQQHQRQYQYTNGDKSKVPGIVTTNYNEASSSPVRRVHIYSNGDADSAATHANKPTMMPRRRGKKSVVLHSQMDINPLRPCGACNEWLKKLAESNPHFKVLTYTDIDCNGVYVTSCQD